MEYAFLSCLSAAHAPNLARRAAQNKPGTIKQAMEALRAGICPAAAAGPTFGGSEDRRPAEGKRGATRGKQPLVFPPRAFRANECDRTHSRSALSERRLGMSV